MNTQITDAARLSRRRGLARLCIPAVVFVFLVCLFPVEAFAFSIESQVNQRKLSTQEQLRFSVIVSDDKSKNLPQPDLPYTFDGFSVLTGPNLQTSIQIVNFQINSTATYSYVLAPLKTGTFTLPSISVTWKGKKYSTREIQVIVMDAPPGGELSFFRLEVSKNKVYVGEQVILEYVLYSSERIADLGFKNVPTLTGFWVEDIEMKKILQTQTEIEGVPYNRLILKQQLLFPTSSGEITIEPITLQLQVSVQSRSRSRFDDFFNNPFFSTRSQTKLENSLAVLLDVLPLPEEGKPAAFNGLVGEYRARASINKQEIKRNDSVTFTITISGKGNIQGIPEPVLPEMGNIKLYSPTVSKKISRSGRGISGSKTFEYIIVPKSEGQLVIPVIEIPYFGPDSQTYKSARTQQFTLNVLPADEGQESPLIVLSPTMQKSEITLLGQDINYIKVGLTSIENQGDFLVQKPWFWLLQVLPLTLIALVAFIKWRQKALVNDVAGTRYRKARNVARKYLKEASSELKNKNTASFYQVLGKGLSTYLADKLNISETGMTTEQLKELLADREVPENVLVQVLDILQQCDFARFAPGSLSNEDLQTALDKARAAINTLERLKLKKKL